MTVPAGNSAQARAHGGADAIIFDCDSTLGLPLKDVDDGLALALLLGQPTVNVVAVTTTFGNGTIEQVCTQTRRLLNRLGRADLPIYRGAAQPTNDKTAAAEFLANAVAQRPGQITIVATGPLTNLRAAATLDRRFFNNVRRIVCMGGYRRNLTVGRRRLREINFSADRAMRAAQWGVPGRSRRCRALPTTAARPKRRLQYARCHAIEPIGLLQHRNLGVRVPHVVRHRIFHPVGSGGRRGCDQPRMFSGHSGAD